MLDTIFKKADRVFYITYLHITEVKLFHAKFTYIHPR